MARFSIGFLLLLLSSTALMQPSQVMAATWQVPLDAPTIQAGIDAAATGDTVLISCGTYLESQIVMKAGITLIGETSVSSCVTIDAQNLGRVLDCVDLTELTRIQNITFMGGHVVDGWFTALGGGVRCLNSNIILSNCIFQGNVARIGAGFGGSESTISLIDCFFNSNAATHETWSAGGAVWARDCSGIIENCQIIENTAFSTNPDNPGDGGGFFFNNSSLDVSHCLFQGNSTGAGAGGFYSVSNDSSVFSDCDFVENTAANGGAVYFEYEAAAQLINCTFTNNIANAGGALVSINNSFPTISDCHFENNQATQWGGGAIDCWGSGVSISGSLFRNNSSETHGGGANFGDCTVSVFNSVFEANSTTGNGGAIRAKSTNISTEGCTLVNNSAASGAGIFCEANSLATVDHCIIAFSHAGESMAGSDDGFAIVSCSDFYGNAGGDWVGYFEGQLLLDGNFSEDPSFCNPSLGDFFLDTNSPCIQGSHGTCGLVGALSVGCSLSGIPRVDNFPSEITEVGNFPNPFNPSTVISFTLNLAGPTKVAIYNLAGRQVRALVNENLTAETHHVTWLGRNDSGREVASGIYFYRITSGGSQITRPLALIK